MSNMPNWTFFLVRLFFGVAGCALITWAGWKLGERAWGLLALVFSCPLIGVAIARPLVELTHDGMAWLWRKPLEDWHGRYYAFNNVQVRVLEEGGRLWFCAEDIATACNMRVVVAALPGLREVAKLSCLSMEGVEALQREHPDPELGRFLLWSRREVVTPWERKRTGALVPR